MGTPAPFKQSDIQRAINAVKKSGLNIQGVEVRPGAIRVLTGDKQETVAKRPEPQL